MKAIKLIYLLLRNFGMTGAASAYELTTHGGITKAAVTASVLDDPSYFIDLGTDSTLSNL